jgi:hypothetical protein
MRQGKEKLDFPIKSKLLVDDLTHTLIKIVSNTTSNIARLEDYYFDSHYIEEHFLFKKKKSRRRPKW